MSKWTGRVLITGVSQEFEWPSLKSKQSTRYYSAVDANDGGGGEWGVGGYNEGDSLKGAVSDGPSYQTPSLPRLGIG